MKELSYTKPTLDTDLSRVVLMSMVKTKSIKRNFKNKNVKFPHVHYAAQWMWRTSQLALCYSQLYLNHRVIC
jgi:hypothetical protein